MSLDPPDRFTEGILDRLDGVEESPRIDRDGRHGLIALGVIVLVLLVMVSFQVVVDRAGGATSDDLEAGLPLVSPATILEAVDRIQVPFVIEKGIQEVPSESGETQMVPQRYEAIDATAPGCRT